MITSERNTLLSHRSKVQGTSDQNYRNTFENCCRPRNIGSGTYCINNGGEYSFQCIILCNHLRFDKQLVWESKWYCIVPVRSIWWWINSLGNYGYDIAMHEAPIDFEVILSYELHNGINCSICHSSYMCSMYILAGEINRDTLLNDISWTDMNRMRNDIHINILDVIAHP